MSEFYTMKPKILRSSTKIFLKDGKESVLNTYIDRRDATVYSTEYRDGEGYNPYSTDRYFLCEDNKSECGGLLKQTVNNKGEIERETYMDFDLGFVETLKNLVSGNTDFKSYYGDVELYINNYYEGEKE